MEKFKKELILQPNTYIHCNTIEKAKELLSWANCIGLKWTSRASYLEYNYFHQYGRNTCYNIYSGSYFNLNDINKACTSNKIYTFEEVLNKNIVTTFERPKIEEDTGRNNGGKTDYYQIESAPFPINDFDDFAEWRKLNGFQFNMGKVMWTFNVGRHNGTDYIRDLNKVIHYANREKKRVQREMENKGN
jgi:hypothetical protein